MNQPTNAPSNEHAESSNASRPPSRRRRRFGFATRLFIMVALLGGVWIATTVMGQPAFEWRTSFDAAQTEATERNVPILLDFWGAYCPPCRMLDIRIFADEDVAATVAKHCVPYKVDVTHAGPTSDAATLAAKYNVQVTPTVMLVDSKTSELIAKATPEDLANVAAFKQFLQR